ncbi:tetratricopeptide repeat protein [Sulfurimonas paralvinellae]|uniref:Tetratricopeptide repeat protein n=1 Tax=Sulfurimonas paralvinellae TaxID=317658 RepID=A0A7M1B601_9BACT|nr:tetratricopeptide repeat protein [Sulfurimonas paralvinellae]QOP44946.1 tetratricopeptide repeat protein [Sulfurimonas paralvinellae]
MRQFVLLLLFIFSMLNASEDTVSTMESYFEKEDYQKACKLAEDFYKANPYSVKANLYYGRCAYRKGDIDTAMAAYDRAEILDDKNLSVHKYLGDLYVHVGNIEIANREYDKADVFGQDRLQRVFKEGYTANKFSLLANVSGGYDSNVEYNAELSDMNRWFGGGGSVVKPKSDTFVKEYLSLTHVYDSNPFSEFYYKNQLQFYNKNYAKYSVDDFTQAEVLSGPGWADKSYDFWLPISYTYMATDYKDYAEVYAVKPQLRKRFENKLLLKLEGLYEYRKYLQWNKGDKNAYGGTGSLSRWFAKHYLRVAYRYEATKKAEKESPRIFIDKKLNEIELNYTYTFNHAVEFGLEGLYSKTSYDDLVQSETREDELYKYSAYLSYNVISMFGFVLKYDNYTNKTNYIPSKYKKEIINLGVYIYY